MFFLFWSLNYKPGEPFNEDAFREEQGAIAGFQRIISAVDIITDIRMA